MNTSTLHLLRQSWRSWLGGEPHLTGPAWLSLLWTFVFSVACALFFLCLNLALNWDAGGDVRSSWELVGPWFPFFLSVSLCIGFTIKALFALGARWLGYARIKQLHGLRRLGYFIGVPMLGVALGWPLGAVLAGRSNLRFNMFRSVDIAASSLLVSLAIATVFYLFFAMARRRLENQKRAVEAQLRLLQGQIEPHFLFNTLANVVSLIDHDAPRAKQMLESFTDYLRSSFASLRQDQATLGNELDLVQHYLTLLKVRMEDRLTFSITCDATVRGAAMPPLLLQPLVENAIHHGLEPKVEGGFIRISVQREGNTLVMEVADNGMGLGASNRRGGAGVALANVRERLQTQWGNAASLTLVATSPGTLATLRIPFEQTGVA